MAVKYYFERSVGWMLNNKVIVFLSLLSFCLFVSTLAIAGQRNRLRDELYDLTSTSTSSTTTTTPKPESGGGESDKGDGEGGNGGAGGGDGAGGGGGGAGGGGDGAGGGDGGAGGGGGGAGGGGDGGTEEEGSGKNIEERSNDKDSENNEYSIPKAMDDKDDGYKSEVKDQNSVLAKIFNRK